LDLLEKFNNFVTINLPNGDSCDVYYKRIYTRVTELTPRVYLTSCHIPHTIIQDVIDGIKHHSQTSDVLQQINHFRFGDVGLNYRGLEFSLLNTIRGDLRRNLQEIRNLKLYLDGTYDFNWITRDFIPDLDQSIDNVIDRTKKNVEYCVALYNEDSQLMTLDYNLYFSPDPYLLNKKIYIDFIDVTMGFPINSMNEKFLNNLEDTISYFKNFNIQVVLES
jgi:hypothetical protein